MRSLSTPPVRLATLVSLGLALLIAAGCDTSEDPALLNPPVGDSTRVRFVNLTTGPITPEIVPTKAATDLQPGSASPFIALGTTQPVTMVIHQSGSTDTLPPTALAQGTATTAIILRDNDTAVRVVSFSTSASERTELGRRLVGRVAILNALDDTSLISIRSGCVSGDAIVTGLGYGATAGTESAGSDISLFFLASDGVTQLGSARVATAPGAVRFIIVTRIAGNLRILEFSGDGTEPGGALGDASPETRTEATLSVLNGTGGAVDIVTANGDPVASGLQHGVHSAPVDVQACTAAGGDSLRVIAAAGDTTTLPVRLRVGARSTIVLLRNGGVVQALDLTRTDNPASGTVALRALNLSGSFPEVSIGAGAGSPDSSGLITRTFAGLDLGRFSGTIAVGAGTYPFLLSDATNGLFIKGGVQALNPGRYTLLVIDVNGVPEMRLLNDDIAGDQPTPLTSAGRRAVLFSIVPDVSVTFTVGSVTFPPIAWRGALQGLVPEDATSVSSDIGTAPLPTAIAYTIGAIGGGGNARVIALAAPDAPPDAGRASVRLLAGFATDRSIALRDAAIPGIPLATSTTGNVSNSFQIEARKYTFVVTDPNDTVTLARIEGVELTNGRHYLLVVGDRQNGDPLTTPAILLVQE